MADDYTHAQSSRTPGDPNLADRPSPSPAKDGLSSATSILKDATDRALIFASNASSETLGACLIGCGATTYFIFGRVGLVLIGFVGGVVLHATWDHSNGGAQDEASRSKEAARRREAGVDIMQRVLDWRDKHKDTATKGVQGGLGIALGQPKSQGISQFKVHTAAALNELIDAVIRDYVGWWYSPILPTELSFPSTCRATLANFVVAVSSNVCRKRPADTFIELTTNSSSILIVFFNELSAALSASPNTSAPEAVQTYMRMKPECSLTSIMDERHQQRKLQMVADDILESYLDPVVYQCAPAKVFLEQILASTILDMTIQKCSRAEWINEWIVYLLEDGEPQLMNVIDAGVGGAEIGQDRGLHETGHAPESPRSPSTPRTSHQRTVSRAEEAMDEAMREAKRLTQMIQEEDKRHQQQQESNTYLSDTSDSTNCGVRTPSSSQSETPVDQSRPKLSANRADPPEIGIAQTEVTANASDAIAGPSFTSFDQLVPSSLPTALTGTGESLLAPQAEPLTLHRAKVQIFDDSEAVEKKTIKSKPVGDYLIQIEPASSSFPGWMMPRTYADFEVLHEVLRRISTISGVDFVRVHATPPAWKGNTKHQLRDEMERYLNDAMCYEQLAESEGMKRFLEKSRGLTQASPAKGFWPNPSNVGKGMLDVLTKAPNQVAGGGKAFLGGVTSVLGGAAGMTPSKEVKRQSFPVSSPSPGPPKSGRPSVDLSRQITSQNIEATSMGPGAARKVPASLDLQRDARPPLQARHSSSYPSSRSPSYTNASPRDPTRFESESAQPSARDPMSQSPAITLPPPPDNIPDDYTSPVDKNQLQDHISHMSVDGTSFFDVPTPPTPRSPRPASPLHRGTPPSRNPSQLRKTRAAASIVEENNNRAAKAKEAEAKRTCPLTDDEAQVTIELLFAVITELYTLSSAWSLRRTLLGAAKTFLLRPGNPQLESIRLLLQETLLDANSSDLGIAAHLRKLRENCLPTEEELATWPKERTGEEKERLRNKARGLLVKRGMPQALTSVMGAAASGEALGKVFDCLQVQDVARGVMFGLMLQAVRAFTQ